MFKSLTLENLTTATSTNSPLLVCGAVAGFFVLGALSYTLTKKTVIYICNLKNTSSVNIDTLSPEEVQKPLSSELFQDPLSPENLLFLENKYRELYNVIDSFNEKYLSSPTINKLDYDSIVQYSNTSDFELQIRKIDTSIRTINNLIIPEYENYLRFTKKLKLGIDETVINNDILIYMEWVENMVDLVEMVK